MLGFLASFALTIGLGRGVDRWVFLGLVWGVLIYAPLRILIESSEAFGTKTRRRLAAQLASDPNRYTHAGFLPLLIRDLAPRAVTLPRICRPQHLQQAIEAAVALIAEANARRDARGAMSGIIRVLVAALAAETASLSAASSGNAAGSIQERWEGARAVGALGALIGIMGAAFADRWGEPPTVSELGEHSLADYLASALDYCDEASLRVDAIPWVGPPLASPPPGPSPADEMLGVIGGLWRAFLNAGLPAPRAMRAFVDAVAPPAA